MTILTVGIDLAKNVFAVHGVDAAGTVLLRQPKVARAKLNALVASLPPCTIGIEACSGAHHWARQFQAHGHSVRLMAPKLVTPYRMSGKRGKNDAADAAAIRDVGHWHNRWSGRFGHKPENTLPSNSLVAPASLYTKAFCSVCGSSASLRGATASLRRGRARSRRAPVIARGL